MGESTSRSNRRSRKAVDYSHEQEFSDDAFEDEATAQAMAAPVVGARSKQSRASTGRRKKKKGDEDEDDNLSEGRSSSAMLAATSTSYQQPSSSTAGPRYVEKGYPSDLPPIPERYLYLPEIEEDGSPRVELIVGRRPMRDEERVLDEDENDEEADVDTVTSNMDAEESEGEGDNCNESDHEVEESDADEEGAGSAKKSGRRGTRKRKASSRKVKPPAKKKAKIEPPSSPININTKSKEGAAAVPSKLLPKATEYEYLIKYRGRSYLHLDWKTASDLESMNKSAKTLYRRFVKKLEAGTVENLADPTVDPSFIEAEKIVDEKDEEILMELTDQELLKWEKEREKEIAQEEEEAKAELALAEDEATAENGEEKVKVKQETETEESVNGSGAPVKKEGPIKKEKADEKMQEPDPAGTASTASNGKVEAKPDETNCNDEEKKSEDDLGKSLCTYTCTCSFSIHSS
jgi:hypothetical protein